MQNLYIMCMYKQCTCACAVEATISFSMFGGTLCT